jgi:signal transduction histidine kinase
MARLERATLVGLAAAFVLPLILFATLQTASALRAQRAQIETDALADARVISATADARLLADQSALQVLSTSQLLAHHDLARAERRIETVRRSRIGWRNVILTDIAAGREVWETRTGAATAGPMRPWVAAYLKGDTHAPAITGVVGVAPECPCVAVHVPVFEGESPRYLLTVELDPGIFQTILMAHSPRGSISAVVDRNGLFVARSLAYQRKLGTPAGLAVREAIVKARTGLYPGVTSEGQSTFGVFDTSAVSGWSAHVGVKAHLLNGPSRDAYILTAIAALAALALIAGVAAFAYRQQRIRRREEARAAQSAKLAAVGQLASGIAHDFNNLLMVISISMERVARKTTDPTLRRSVDNALAATERGARLISQLMAFTRSQPLDLGPVDLRSMFGNLQDLLQQSVGPTIQLAVYIGDDARWVTSNVGQLEMALMNLAVNARDAMREGGKLTFRSSLSKGGAHCVDLDVIDTGDGMSKAVLDRALEPFFTTKPVGQGTGLGLAQVFGVVTQSGGSVEIRSAPGAGTTVSLRLERATPLAEPGALAAAE